MKIKFNKNDLEMAFKQGEIYDFRPSWYNCFNKWFNKKYIDENKCYSCLYSEQKNQKKCKECNEFLLFKQNVNKS